MISDTSRGEAPWPSYALPLGTAVNGYRIERMLGSGGFGITYLASDLLMQRFAIKEYYPRQFAIRQDMTVLAAIGRRRAAVRGVPGPLPARGAGAGPARPRVAGASDGIVRVQTYFEAHGTCFLVMDYVEGTSLAGILRQRTRRPRRRACALAADPAVVRHPRRPSGRADASRHQAGQHHPAR